MRSSTIVLRTIDELERMGEELTDLREVTLCLAHELTVGELDQTINWFVTKGWTTVLTQSRQTVPSQSSHIPDKVRTVFHLIANRMVVEDV